MQVQALNNFRQNLRTALENRGVSYRTFAESSGLTYVYVYRICNPDANGKPEPSIEVCDKIADALGYQLADMLVSPKQFKTTDRVAV